MAFQFPSGFSLVITDEINEFLVSQFREVIVMKSRTEQRSGVELPGNAQSRACFGSQLEITARSRRLRGL